MFIFHLILPILWVKPKIPKNHPKNNKTPQNKELSNEHRVSGLLKM